MKMNENPCLLAPVRELVNLESKMLLAGEHHPLLMLDKYSRWPSKEENGRGSEYEKADEEKQRYLDRVIKANNGKNLPGAALQIRDQIIRYAKANGGCWWAQQLTTPMALHLARATAMENVGICLHPTYGFAYMPGSGLKGIARAYAETVWLPQQPDQAKAWSEIERVFGWARTKGRKERLKQYPVLRVHNPEQECSGRVVFHDAWPTGKMTPQLTLDIVNPHHHKYYTTTEKPGSPPGDWEDPRPNKFLAIRRETSFDFIISPIDSSGCSLVQYARDWLIQGLSVLSAGAKTNSGYGTFISCDKSLQGIDKTAFSGILRVTTPALLAGACQKKEDCDLRGASIRGQVRWWWRTLHAAHLSANDLLKLESAVWGSTSKGGAIRVEVHPHTNNPEPKILQERVPSKNVVKMLRAKRFHLEPPAQWRIVAHFNQKAIAHLPELVFDQIRDSFWLWSQYAGVGFRSRKGFGSFIVVGEESNTIRLKDCIHRASEFRKNMMPGSQGSTGTPAIETLLTKDVATKWKDPWEALNRIGRIFGDLCKDAPLTQVALGTGRSHIPLNTRGHRHPAPFFAKLILDHEGGYTARVSAMADEHLRPEGESKNWHANQIIEIWKEFCAQVESKAEISDCNTRIAWPDFEPKYPPVEIKVRREPSELEAAANKIAQFRKQFPLASYHAERNKGNHGALIQGFEALKVVNSASAELLREYLDAIYPKGEVRKKANQKKEKLYCYLAERLKGLGENQ